MPSRAQTSLGILAGGRGLRMGAADKALMQVGGTTQLQRMLDALAEGFAGTLVSYNALPPQEPRWSGLRWFADVRPGQQGPLAGLETLLMHARTPWLLTAAVDLAHPERLDTGLLLAGQGGRVLVDAEGRQPLLALWPVAASLEQVRVALDRGERAVHAVVDALALEAVSVAPLRIGNLNSMQDLDLLT